MKLKVKILKFLAGKPVCMINDKTAEKMGFYVENRIVIKKGNKKLISIIDISENIGATEIGVSDEIVRDLKLKNGDRVEAGITQIPPSIGLIRKKLEGHELNLKELTEIVSDISNNELTEAEIAFFISAVHNNDMTLNETKSFITAMIKSGSRLKLKGKVADKHCIGGVAGNRTTPIIISICTTTGLIMPKTSSRAITSAAGTADTIESLARVDFSIEEIKGIIKKTNACFVWGGTLGLAPADDKIIRVGRVMKIDSTSQLLASILSKKISVGSKYILIDIPYGKSAKVTKRKAKKLKEKFLILGKKFGLKLKVELTDGSCPIGDGVGPILEMRDVIKVLRRDKDAPKDLEEKSLFLSGRILEMTGKAKKNKGLEMAKEILDSRKAWLKFEEIIIAQKGKIKDLPLAKYKHHIFSRKRGEIKGIDNNLINSLARIAGCPEDKYSGIFFNRKLGKVEKHEQILTIYSSSEEKLKQAIKFYNEKEKEMILFK